MLDLVQKSPASSFQRYIYAPTHNFLGGSDGKASAYSAGDRGSNPWVGKIPWRRKWPSAPVFLPGECHGWRSLVGSPWGHKESDTTEWLHLLSFFLHAVLVLFSPWSFYGNSSLMPDLSVVGSEWEPSLKNREAGSSSKSVTEHVSHV